MINKEDFKVIPKFPSYGINQDGDVLRFSTGKILARIWQGPKKYKYQAARLGNAGKITNIKLHKLVAEVWLPKKNPEHTQVNHKDGNKANNHKDNLKWVTASENIQHAVQTKLKPKGDKLYNSSVTDEQVHEICRLLQDNLTVKDIAERYNITKDAVRKIRAGDTYFHIRSLYTINNNYISDFSESTVRWVCSQIVQGKSDETIAKISTNSKLKIIDVKRIRHKIRYKDISCEYF